MVKRFFCDEIYNSIEITERQPILYGVCHNAMVVSDQLGIQEYAYVIDSAPGKWGHFVKIGRGLYQIVSPDILGDLDVENYYICTFTEKYNEEIRKYIQHRYKKGFLYIDNPKQLAFGYTSLGELFENDIYTISKCIELNVFRDIKRRISQISEVLETLGKVPCYYMPLQKGRKILIRAICTDEVLMLTICSSSSKIPYLQSWYGNAKDVRNEEYEFIAYNNDIGWSSNITYYSDYGKGLLIQKYCSQQMDFKSNVVRSKILQEIRRIHSTGVTVPIYTYPFKRFASLFLTLDKVYQEKLYRIRQFLCEYEKDFSSCRFVLSHGDLHPGNIVFDADCSIFIDWECICMTYEWYDVCRFLFYSQIDELSSDMKQYEEEMLELYENVGMLLHYYDNEISSVQIVQAKKILFLCEVIELCLRISKHQASTERLIDIIENHISLIER